MITIVSIWEGYRLDDEKGWEMGLKLRIRKDELGIRSWKFN